MILQGAGTRFACQSARLTRKATKTCKGRSWLAFRIG
jgi:hypothetical protein